MFTKYLALVSETSQVSFSEVSKIASALQKQITRDFSPIWNVPATIDVFENLDDVPSDYWSILIKDDIGFPGAAGIHLDRNGQPYALVQASENVALTCSHESLEMLADPFGNRLVASQSVKPGQGRVKYLIEVCDPSEDEQFAYTINGIIVSDFYTPHYFDPVTGSSVRYSYTGAINAPRQILKGGYLSWMLPETGEWWQATYFGSKITFRSLGVLARENGKSWREIIDSKTFEPVKKAMRKKIKSAPAFINALRSSEVTKADKGTSNQLKEDIQALLNGLK